MIRYTKGGKLIPATWDEAVKFAAEKFKAAGTSVGVIASPRLTNESVFTLKRFALEAAGSENFAVAEDSKLDSIFDNLSVDLCTHKEIRYAKVIVLIGGEPEEEQTYTAKQIRQAVRNGGAKFICVNDTPINLTRRVTQFVHVNPGTADAFALALADPSTDSLVADKLGIDAGEIVAVRQIINDAQGDVIFMVGNELSAEAQAIIAGTAAKFAGEGRRVLLHPLAKYNNSVGAHDMMPGSRSADQVVSGSKALLIGGSLQSTDGLAGKDFIAVQELFMTETAEFADVVFPAASFAEIDGTFTNNAGNVQRVRKAIEPLHRSKPDWVIASLIAREMGVDFGYDFSASLVFKSLAESVPAYEGLRYPALKDESNPARASYAVAASPDVSGAVTALKARVESMSGDAEKITETPRVGHKLHRLTTMTSKTEQFHLLAHGNPKPGNLLVSPLFQFALDGKPLDEDLADSAEVGAADRSLVGK
ncbi:MAG: molybdopterin-dependent oxidoreductase [Chloracidobacterium sp.]|nr:molybdopterin-dependent oxidoreductase [Chloracidobacterium sp.]